MDNKSQSPDTRSMNQDRLGSVKKKRAAPQSAHHNKVRSGVPVIGGIHSTNPVFNNNFMTGKNSMKQVISIPESTRAFTNQGSPHTRPISSLESPNSKRKVSRLRKQRGTKSTLDLISQKDGLTKNTQDNNRLLTSNSSKNMHSRPMTGNNGLNINHQSQYGSIIGSFHGVRPNTAFYSQQNGKHHHHGHGHGHAHGHPQSYEYLSQSDIPIDIKLATAKKNLMMKSTISIWTKQENQEVDKALDTITTLEKNIERKSSQAKLDRIDCKNILLKANREIKCLNYELMNIVQSRHDDNGNVIISRKPFEIEVIQEAYMTFKVQVRGQPSPAKLSCIYREQPVGSLRSDLKVYCSTTAKEPKENNCAKQFTNDVQQLQQDKQSKVDFISKNMEQVQHDPEDLQNQKLFKIRTTWQRIETAKSKKNMMELEQRKKNMFLLHRWEFLKEKRAEMKKIAIKSRLENNRKYDWVRYIITCQMMKHIYTVFYQKREVATREAQIQFAVNMFAIKFKLWSQKKRPTAELRSQQSIVKVKVVQVHYQRFKNAQELRISHFTKVLWEKEKSSLLKICMTKKNKKKQEIWKKINLIEPSIRDAIIKCYMKRCKLRFQQRFLEWRLDFKFNTVTDQIREREQEKINKKRIQKEAIEKLLFANIFLPDEEPPEAPQPPPQKDDKKVKAPAKKGKQEVPVEPPKPVLTPLQRAQGWISYGDLEEVTADMPILRFMPANKEVIQRLIIKATIAKSDKEFVNILK
ncbi:UNKNOWN [Stylonychia lemnae]|uniref:Uncharacterized protein n=1 Tax=Stylonychia lemnae TaxID=5949 RepID=A0A078AQA2_STYLE|nr:UNKNOWN [Stylonychia lemnae]|eukprot:CDW83422.1 UNKNOWN [Stylonychia lemnae]